MEDDEFRLLIREYSVKLDQLQRKHLNFKRRVCIFLNIIVPGLGYFMFGAGYGKGIISFVLFYGYSLIYHFYILQLTDMGGAVIYAIPAVVVWMASTIGVGGLED